ncbi:MAG: methyltransferase [Gemmataceae bacterium]
MTEGELAASPRATIRIGPRSFTLAYPSGQELNASVLIEPYWSKLWPMARSLARIVLEDEGLPAEGSALELGCGLGLGGLAALARGYHTIFSDLESAALSFAGYNARLNRLDNFSLCRLDWREPPAELRVPLILGSDISYEDDLLDPLAALVQRVLQPGGLCLWTDGDRTPSLRIYEALRDHELYCDAEPVVEQLDDETQFTGTLYRIRHNT